MLSPLSFYDEQEKQAERREQTGNNADKHIKPKLTHNRIPLFFFVDRRGLLPAF